MLGVIKPGTVDLGMSTYETIEKKVKDIEIEEFRKAGYDRVRIVKVVKSDEGFIAYERKIDVVEGKYEEKVIAGCEEAKKLADAISNSILVFAILAGIGLAALGVGLGLYLASESMRKNKENS